MPPHFSTSSRVKLFHPDTIYDRDFGVECSSAVCLNLCADLRREIVATVIVEGDIRAFAREYFADRRTDTARSAGYKRAFSFKQKTHS